MDLVAHDSAMGTSVRECKIADGKRQSDSQSENRSQKVALQFRLLPYDPELQRRQASRYGKTLSSPNVENRCAYHRTVVWIAVGEALSFAASLKTTDAAMTKANNAIIAAKSIDLGSRPRLSKLLRMVHAPVTDASSNVRLRFGSNPFA